MFPDNELQRRPTGVSSMQHVMVACDGEMDYSRFQLCVDTGALDPADIGHYFKEFAGAADGLPFDRLRERSEHSPKVAVYILTQKAHTPPYLYPLACIALNE